MNRSVRRARRFILRTEGQILAAMVELEKAGFGVIGPGLEEYYRMGLSQKEALANLREGIRMHEDDMMAHEDLRDIPRLRAEAGLPPYPTPTHKNMKGRRA